MKLDRVLSMVGLASKARKVQSGADSTERAIKRGRAKLVFIAKDASANTVKQFKNLCSYRNIPYYIYGSSDALGSACGKGFRMTAAVCDSGFAKAIMKKMDEQFPE